GSSRQLHDLLRAVGHVGGGDQVQSGVLQDLLAQLDVGALEPHHQRHLQPYLLHRGDDAGGDGVALHDAAEDVDEDAAHPRVVGDDLERSGDLLRSGAASNIQEVGGRASVVLDDVHGGHGEAGAVHHAADVAVEVDVAEVM